MYLLILLYKQRRYSDNVIKNNENLSPVTGNNCQKKYNTAAYTNKVNKLTVAFILRINVLCIELTFLTHPYI